MCVLYWLYTCVCCTGCIHVCAVLAVYMCVLYLLYTCVCCICCIHVCAVLAVYMCVLYWLYTCVCCTGCIHVCAVLAVYMCVLYWLYTCVCCTSCIHVCAVLAVLQDCDDLCLFTLGSSPPGCYTRTAATHVWLHLLCPVLPLGILLSSSGGPHPLRR